MGSKTIAILTSGGDSPGMNAAVWAAVKSAYSRGMTILGIKRGYQGLIDGDMIELTPQSIADVHNHGGTMLKTARCLKMKTEEGRAEAVASARAHGIDGLIVVGGDGSYQGAAVLASRGIPTIGLPGTIDNDLAYTDYTLGYDTACNTACQAALQVRDTMESHDRIGIVEVMGRYCGDIALNVALATGADYVLVPEVDYPVAFDITNLADRLCSLRGSGRSSFLIILAEGICFENPHRAYDLRLALEAELCKRGVQLGDIRETVLAYQQRGGHPTVFDINLAVQMADHAVGLLSWNIGNRAVGIRQNKIFDMDIMEALRLPRVFNRELYDMVQRLASV
jgi:6-phosphofructokinase 1